MKYFFVETRPLEYFPEVERTSESEKSQVALFDIFWELLIRQLFVFIRWAKSFDSNCVSPMHRSPVFRPLSHFLWRIGRESERDRWRLLNSNLSIIPTLGPGGCLSLSPLNPSTYRSSVVYMPKSCQLSNHEREGEEPHTRVVIEKKIEKTNWNTFRNESRVNVNTLYVCKVRVSIYKWVNRCTERKCISSSYV